MRQNRMKHITFGDQYHDSLDNPKDVKRVRWYGVDMFFSDNKKKKHLNYTMKVHYHRQINRSSWIVSLTKSDVFINNKKPDYFKQELDLDFGLNVLYPIQLTISQRGSVERINSESYTNILKRFEEFKQRTLKSSAGVHVERYIQNLEQQIQNKNHLLKCLLQEWFYSLYFTPLYGRIAQDYTMFLPIETGTNITAISGVLIENKDITYHDTKQIQFKGEKVLNRFSKHNGCTVKSVINYNFSSETNVIKHIRAINNIHAADKIIESMSIRVSHLREKDLKPEPEKPKFSTKEKIISFLDKIL